MDKPIMFCSDMVRAYQAGRKTCTRRTAGLEVVNQNPNAWAFGGMKDGVARFESAYDHTVCKPRFQVGDRPWVKEAIQLYNSGVPIRYQADCAPVMVNGESADLSMWKWKHRILPSMFMPRQFSRFTLPITGVGCQRLQDISPEDCIAEGLVSFLREHEAVCDLKNQYYALWDKLNAKKYLWSSNPWVWVYKFSEVNKHVR